MLEKPAIEVPIYRRNLRRELMRAAGRQSITAGASRFGLSLATFSAGLFAVLLILFVARPEVPALLNQRITGSEHRIERPPTEVHGIPDIPSSADPYRIHASESDRRLAEAWLEDRVGQRLELVENKDLVTARRFVAEDGREIVVYTHLPAERGETTVIY